MCVYKYNIYIYMYILYLCIYSLCMLTQQVPKLYILFRTGVCPFGSPFHTCNGFPNPTIKNLFFLRKDT